MRAEEGAKSIAVGKWVPTGPAGFNRPRQVVIEVHVDGLRNVAGLESRAACPGVGEVETAVEHANVTGFELAQIADADQRGVHGR